VPFTWVHAGKYRAEDKIKTDNTDAKHNPEKANNTKQQNKTTPVQSLHITLDQEKRLGSLHNAREPTHAVIKWVTVVWATDRNGETMLGLKAENVDGEEHLKCFEEECC